MGIYQNTGSKKKKKKKSHLHAVFWKKKKKCNGRHKGPSKILSGKEVPIKPFPDQFLKENVLQILK